MIDFESNVEIDDLGAWMDGGSVTLKCNNTLNQEFEIEFVQSLSMGYNEGQKIPGRIYLNNVLVEQRSDLEKRIIRSLVNSTFKEEGDYDRRILEEKLNYVKSECYISDQSRIEKIKRT